MEYPVTLSGVEFAPETLTFPIDVKLLSSNAIAPTRAHQYDAGLDLYAAETVVVTQFDGRVTIPTDIAVDIPKGYVGLIFDRSSMAIRGFKVAGGVVDHGYSGNVKVVLHTTALGGIATLEKGSKIAQLLVVPIATPIVNVVNEFQCQSDRGENGFGSTGT